MSMNYLRVTTKFQFHNGEGLGIEGKLNFRLTGTMTRQLEAISQDLAPQWMSPDKFERMLETYAILFRLNEMEVAAWHSSMQDAHYAAFDPERLMLSLWLAAYNAKSSLCGDMEDFNEVLRADDQDFELHWAQWQLLLPSFTSISLRKVSESFQRLNSFSHKIDNLKTANGQVEELFMQDSDNEIPESQSSSFMSPFYPQMEECPGQFSAFFSSCQDKSDSKVGMEWYDDLGATLENYQI